ncbi:uncharacterized protein LOC132280855 [Cornus florida]|uniref:uncharacterized protein LOC132280855 n=1 Tax=Cornus florida TaxID=4283 RepID=UPI00289AC204|nr:uncharacterized protein LOC132280855 [Cornus florida]
MRLNPTKCSFGMSFGQFLGHVVNHRGIEASLVQAEALTKNAEPKTITEVQALTGRIVALSHFISKLSDRCKPFFDTIRSHGRQAWGDEQRQTLTSLKEYMQNPPVLLAPEPGEKLFLYLGVSSIATSGVLIRCKEGKQYPVFYVSKTMIEAERRYSRAERVILSLVHAKRKLRHYFESHPIVVQTTFPIRIILHKPDLSGRMMKWAIELSSFDITYEPRMAIKGQAVADFLLECDSEDVEEDLRGRLWKLFVDGSSNQMGAGIGVKLQTPEGTSLSQALRLKFQATNNEAEYETLLAGLELAKELKVRNLTVFSDSQLIIRQVNGEYETKDVMMEAYHSAIMREARDFENIKFIQVPREHNEDADRLACSVSGSGETLARVILVGVLNQPSIFEEPSGSDPWQVNVIPYEPSWIDPIVTYIRDGILPERRDEARKVKSNAAKYAIVHNQLYRRSFSGPYLKSVTPVEARQILRTIHEGVCGNHSGGRSIVMDNGTNLDSKQVKKLLEEYGINQKLAAVSHPQANGQAEIMNRTIFACIKKKLEEKKGKLLDELLNVLWAYRITPRRPTRESPYAMAYGSEAVIPVEHLVPTIRSLAWSQSQNDSILSHNKRVKHKDFALGDLVLKKKVGIVKKMMPPWEGLYRIAEVIGKEAYTLETMAGRLVNKPWNATFLKRYCP